MGMEIELEKVEMSLSKGVVIKSLKMDDAGNTWYHKK